MSNTALTSSSRGSLKAGCFLLGGKPKPDSTLPAALPSVSVSPWMDRADGRADRDAHSWLGCGQAGEGWQQPHGQQGGAKAGAALRSKP